MLIKKGAVIEINHCRKGKFKAHAMEDFDTEKDEWYRVKAAEVVYGMSQDWEIGEEIPCGASFCTVRFLNAVRGAEEPT